MINLSKKIIRLPSKKESEYTFTWLMDLIEERGHWTCSEHVTCDYCPYFNNSCDGKKNLTDPRNRDEIIKTEKEGLIKCPNCIYSPIHFDWEKLRWYCPTCYHSFQKKREWRVDE